jgi:arylsulfatase A-like enzyme
LPLLQHTATHARFGATAIAWTIALTGTLACARSSVEVARPHKPNLLLITIDTTRADHTSADRVRHPTTPALEELAAGGTRFEVAYATMASTGPKHASLFTGKYPSTLGYLKNGRTLGEGFKTLAEWLRDSGYQTAAIVSSFAIHAQFGFAQGFDYYHDDFPVRGGSFNDAASSWHRSPDIFREWAL